MKVSDTFVSVVAPLCDDADIIDAFVADTLAVLEANYANFEVVLVDDGSRDGTASRISELLKQFKCVRYLRLSKQFGVEVAITAGLESVIGDFAVVMIPESDPPALIPELVRRARAGKGVVVGVRTTRPGEPAWARIGATLFYSGAARFLSMDVPINATHFQVLSRQAVNAVTRTKDKYRSLRLLSVGVGFGGDTFAYEPVCRRPTSRRRGFLESVSLAVSLAVSQSTRPLRLVSLLGLGASGLNLLYAAYVVAIYLFKDDVAEGWTTTSLQLSSMFFLLFLIMTVLAEYVGRILDESRERPLYHVMEERNSNVVVADLERRNVVKESALD